MWFLGVATSTSSSSCLPIAGWAITRMRSAEDFDCGSLSVIGLLDQQPDSGLPKTQGGISMNIGFDQPLYLLPFDHRESFETKLFGWEGALSAEHTAEIAAAKRVIYDGFQAAIAGGAPKDRAAILVDEQFGADILRDAARQGYMTACPVE